MLRLAAFAIAAAGLGAMPVAADNSPTTASCAAVSNEQVAALFDRWNASLSTKDPAKVAANYAADAVLLPTVENTATTPDQIKAYFTNFLKKEPNGKIDTRTINLGCNEAFDVGTYTFDLKDADGKTSKVAARYSFIYELRDNDWKIVHHHSSAMPVKVN
jgi:uncharacterized protein (TIGR02246 family)